MLVRGADGIIVEVINNQGIAIRWEMDVKFEKQRNKRSWCWACGREREEDVSTSIDKVKQYFGRQVWAQT